MTTYHTRLSQAIASALAGAIREGRRTQRQVAEESGIPLVTLNRKLGGRRPFTVTELAAVCEVLSISVTEVVSRADRALSNTAA